MQQFNLGISKEGARSQPISDNGSAAILFHALQFLAIYLILFVSITGLSQTPPPNDNFSNAIVLTGTDVTFSGTLAGATVEDQREVGTFDNMIGESANQSVWWTWTAPISTILNFEILNSSYVNPGAPGIGAGFVVYNATNGGTSPDGLVLPALGMEIIDSRLAPQTLSIPVVAGSNYYIQLVGETSASYNLRLIATNTPVIIKQPRSQVVYSNASALFYVMSMGLVQSNFTFQWFLNGTNLSGETRPMLALNNIDSGMAGDYSVVVSNAAGFTVSQPATLTVSQSNAPISLAVVGTVSNTMMFNLTGENGRNYRLESSTNLVSWTPELNFPQVPYILFYTATTSVFFNTNSPTAITVTNNAVRKFFRATPYVIISTNNAPCGSQGPDVEICINNLQQTRIAKLLWARDYDQIQNGFFYMSPVATPRLVDILPYFPHQLAPACPDDCTHEFQDSYTINSLQTAPACEISPTNHVIEAPQ
jgi:hypothetical protein